MATNQRVEELIGPVVERLGFELVALETKQAGQYSVLGIYLDKPGGINLDECGEASRAISRIMDVENPITGKYRLEVSSPGLNRPLTKLAHYERFVGEIIKVKLRMPIDDARNFKGVLLSVTSEGIELKLEDESTKQIGFSDIEKANLVPQLG